jgi:hypothetical protein
MQIGYLEAEMYLVSLKGVLSNFLRRKKSNLSGNYDIISFIIRRKHLPSHQIKGKSLYINHLQLLFLHN